MQATDALKQHCSDKGSELELKQTQEGPKHATVFKVLNPQPSTLNTQHSTLNTQHSTLNTQPQAGVLQGLERTGRFAVLGAGCQNPKP